MKIYLLPLSLLFMLVISPSKKNRGDKIQLITTSLDLYLNGEKVDAKQFEIGNSYKVIRLISGDHFDENQIASDLTGLILETQNSSRFDFIVYVIGDPPNSASLTSKTEAYEAIIPIFVDKEKILWQNNPSLEETKSAILLLDRNNHIVFSADSLNEDFKEFVLGIDSNLPRIIDSKLDHQIRF